MAKVLRQESNTARRQHHCYRCGHTISAGDSYLAVTFRGLPADGWYGIRYAKVCRFCQPHPLCTCGDCDFVVADQIAEPIGILEAAHG